MAIPKGAGGYVIDVALILPLAIKLVVVGLARVQGPYFTASQSLSTPATTKPSRNRCFIKPVEAWALP